MKKLIEPLKHGDSIALVSPGFCATAEVFVEGEELLKSFGFRVKQFGASNPLCGRFNDTDEARARHVERAFLDSDVSAILAVKGGYGTFRLTRYLDFELLKDRAKIFVGYSDVTALLAQLYDKCGVPTFHAPMLVDMLKPDGEENASKLVQVLLGQTKSYSLGPGEFTPIELGYATGKTIGGNITVLQSLIGTCSLSEDGPKIVFLEDVGEYLYSVERSLMHLKVAGLFENASAVLFGSLILKDATGPSSLGHSLSTMLREFFSDFHGPIVTDLPFGHGNRQLAIPYGVNVDIDVMQNGFKMDFKNFWS